MNQKNTFMSAVLQATKNGYLSGSEKTIAKIVFDWTFGDIDTHVIYSIIFSHDFARAFFGEIDFKKHLKRMVVLSDPLIYLSKFVELK